jgi:signal transduction histidine kinase
MGIKKSRKDIIFYLVIFYVLSAAGWWSYLLYLKNEDALTSKKELLWYAMKDNGITDRQFYLESVEYTKLEERYSRQNKMILGEGIVLLLLTILGIGRIAKSRQKELELANQQRNFLLSITHELKSPIAAIKLILQTFQKRKLTPEQTQMLTTNALKDTERLHKLVKDLLLAARVDGGYQYIYEEVDLLELIVEAVGYCQTQYKGVIQLTGEKDIILLQKVDKSTLLSVFVNLITNAIKYAPNTETIEVFVNKNKDTVVVQIKDQGIGIAKEEKEKVFDKFYRVGNEDTRQTKGTGLGLYITQKIIIAHKGRIMIKDNPPQGTIFEVELPIN